LQHVRPGSPDVILLDLRLAGQSGLEIHQRIRQIFVLENQLSFGLGVKAAHGEFGSFQGLHDVPPGQQTIDSAPSDRLARRLIRDLAGLCESLGLSLQGQLEASRFPEKPIV
jgi:CheY-like chemotaxis protein